MEFRSRREMRKYTVEIPGNLDQASSVREKMISKYFETSTEGRKLLMVWDGVILTVLMKIINIFSTVLFFDDVYYGIWVSIIR